ncbi:cytoplasmic phosphatidylinositol transfer protein 1-like, partial [Mustelus asterias]
CSFLPKFSIRIETRFEDNNGSNYNVFDGVATPVEDVCCIDILSDPYPERCYKAAEDPRIFRSVRTGRGPLTDSWRDTSKPVMCSYKLVMVKFEMYGLQSRVEQLVHKNIRDILLVGHREAFAWIDEWIDMSVEEVRQYEREKQKQTNQKMSTAALSGTEWWSVLRVNSPSQRLISLVTTTALHFRGNDVFNRGSGSELRPRRFTIFMKDLDEGAESIGAKFAFNTKIVTEVDSSAKEPDPRRPSLCRSVSVREELLAPRDGEEEPRLERRTGSGKERSHSQQ